MTKIKYTLGAIVTPTTELRWNDGVLEQAHQYRYYDDHVEIVWVSVPQMPRD